MSIEDNDDTEKPLDPATERLRRKMVRLLVVSIGIMTIGLMAVLAAIVYRTMGGPGPLEGIETTIALPAGSEVLDSSLDGKQALLRVRNGSEVSLYLVSLTDGSVTARYALPQ
ncbi:MAG: hypothetical protein CL627_08585 [Aurantimonas sp.]|uniref:hypothetical protein n=1 Tax=Aurantimonas TaxID=182269 RepID=UPI000C37E0D0|nr:MULTISPECIES: hypothetical protein [Aurantimonas]MAY29270.1 hypothetical protein [Aurantimonas sp.]MBC6715569.1 hypothetical protein [Aurantimonas sp. DM33-3]MCD1643000.1 hypothetical protein [Aurantimonas coralicida]MDX1731747.1 hypothetical protein [Aurantimonas coralicida]